ncbi:TetR/AcrR family transcriptional regulator [Nocardia sp. CA-107356]|uniref:TetR/AcrR family transcriptional regulator n=1 Tax=Nocardia sp. CA-107356 TaxID=3239972 RepID=UPI003D89E851
MLRRGPDSSVSARSLRVDRTIDSVRGGLHEPGSVGGTPRNAAATREAILQSAVIAFTMHGYDGVGVREIAQSAGVTAMLVNRHFGSKEQLFAEAVDAAFTPRTVLSDDLGTLSGDVAARLVERTAPESEHLDRSS